MIEPDFVFYHIPKCGGTTVRDYLYRVLSTRYDNNEIYYPRITKEYRPVYGNKNLSTSQELETVTECLTESGLNKLKAIICHVKYDTDYLSFKQSTPVELLVMRDPVDRLISHYNFFDTRLFDGREISELSVDQLRLYCESRGNVMFSYLRGRTDTGYIGSIEDAKHNIDRIEHKFMLENINTDLPVVTKNIMKQLEIECRLPSVEWLQKGAAEPTRYQELYQTISDITCNFADNRLYKHMQQTIK